MSSIIPSPIGPATTAKRGTMSAADKSKLDAVTGTNTGDVTLAAVGSAPAAEGASLAGQVLTLQPADATHPGAVTTGAQEFGGAKTLTGAILNGVTTIVEATTALIRAIGVSLVLRSSLGAGSTDKCVVVGTSEVDGTVNAAARLQEWQTGIGGTPVTKAYLTKAGYFYGERLNSISSATTYVHVDSSSARLVYGSSQLQYYGDLSHTNGAYTWSIRTAGRFDQSGTDSSASPGAATINKPTGKSAIASGATSVRITNSQVAAGDQVHATMQGDCGQRHWCEAGAGFFDLKTPAAVSGDTAFCWTVSKRM